MILKFKKHMAVLIVVLIILVSVSSIFALEDGNGRVEIRIKPGNTITINGENVSGEKAFSREGRLYVPLRSVMEAFGAEVNWLGSGKLDVVYRDVSVEMTLGECKYIVNQEESELSAAPLTINKTTMIPVDVIGEYFGAYISRLDEDGVTRLTLEDDGALSDLSFLIGAISKAKIGNSYFGWNINVPKGSKLSSSSFNSKYIMIENENRGISLEITVDADKDKSLEEYFSDIKDNPYNYVNGTIIETNLYKNQNPDFIELLYNNNYEEAVVHRIYMKKGYIYSVVLTSYNETNPWKLKEDAYYNAMMNSFSMLYPKDGKDIQDISKVKYGLAKYENYIENENGQKYLTWEISILPEWDRLYSNSSNPFLTELGLDRKEYIGVEILKPDKKQDIERYAEDMKAFYDENFNPKYYSFIQKQPTEIAGYKAFKLVYSVKMGNNSYIYDESLILVGDMIFDLVLKTPEKKYQSEKGNYYKMLDTLKLNGANSDKLDAEMEKYTYNLQKNRVDKDDKNTLFENKTYGWSIELPGYWMKNSFSESYYQSFTNNSSGAVIAVEAVENTGINSSMADEDKFYFMNSAINNNAILIKKYTLNEKNTTVRAYSYRLENKNEDTYADMNFYVLNNGKYSYCFMSAITDVCTSEKNLEELKVIWESFTFLKPTKSDGQ